MKAPSDCHNMTELRVEIDALDSQIVALIKRRSGYIDRAAELKPAEGLPARIDTRVEEVVAKVRARAEAEGLDPALVETLWRQMIDWSIAREEKVLGA
ncbi:MULTISPECIES: chorismate mutase [Gemmobacter]|jgi:isochorismate pyruvate lyase|uniref:chorismate mutase n=2 Tax=Gemmobacter TaxID=204456 RepID=A0A2T6AW47_9RHOB|nr:MULTISPECIES: chorismate mutase [Gemmobacter]OJY34117.1 MAG: chorismate mutase [Rhodobacterales bacterium 65-51]PTX47976.1 chorismate mutase [Gemmobacter caeni]TWI97302.1 chorismate mutase [Gemmobacter caeni]GHC30431.1 chorismate mutase [Gemmobacter nanjingensis]